MTIQLPLPLKPATSASADKSPPINRLREHLHARGRSLIACLQFVADEVGADAGYLLIDEARRSVCRATPGRPGERSLRFVDLSDFRLPVVIAASIRTVLRRPVETAPGTTIPMMIESRE